MISDQVIEKVKAAADIVDVIGSFLDLKKAGRTYKAISPFTKEKTPSFTVFPETNTFKDFSSGKSGDTIEFLRLHGKYSFIDAIKWMAQRYGIEVEEKQATAEDVHKQRLIQSNEWAVHRFKDWLFRDGEGSVGLDYLEFRGRADKNILDLFKVGYAPAGWKNLVEVIHSTGMKFDAFFETGLIRNTPWERLRDKAKKGKMDLGLLLSLQKIKKNDPDHYQRIVKDALAIGLTPHEIENIDQVRWKPSRYKIHDEFRDRVIFPICNLSGQVVGFGGRDLSKQHEASVPTPKFDAPKYINSSESLIYSKRDMLYGLYEGKTHIRKADKAFLVEGYLDVIACHMSDLPNVVASSGTALTGGQVRLLKKYTNNITVMYDGDSAGMKAASEGVNKALEEGMNVKLVLLPEGMDPDEFTLTNGKEQLHSFIAENEMDFIIFKIAVTGLDQIKDPRERATKTREIVESIALIPDDIIRHEYYKSCAVMLDTSPEALTKAGEAARKDYLYAKENKVRKGYAGSAQSKGSSNSSNTPGQSPRPRISAQSRKPVLPEDEVLGLLLNYGDKPFDDGIGIALWILEEADDIKFTDPLKKKLFDSIRYHLSDKGTFNEMRLMELPTDLQKVAEQIKSENRFIRTGRDNSLPDHVFKSLIRIKYKIVRQLAASSAANLKKQSDPTKQDNIAKFYMKIKGAEKELAEILGVTVTK